MQNKKIDNPFSLMVVTIVFLSVCLTGCGKVDEPSVSEIEQLFKDDVKKSPKIIIHSVRKIGCVTAQNAPGFVCDIETDITAPDPFFGNVKRNKQILKLRFVNDGDKWNALPS